MFSPDQYQLIDFGEGRRLESFGPAVLDRPCPAAESVPKHDPAAWQRADARFERTEGKQGEWTSADEPADRWTIRHPPLTLELKRTEFGHLGLFPEQAGNWDWIAGQLACFRLGGSRREGSCEGNEDRPPRPHPQPLSQRERGVLVRPARVLNLFAYTGGSTLAAAAAGAEVTHVDAAKNVVAWARRNAELSGMAGAPIRWIVEDVMKFVRRELKRESRYDTVILDPPSYGHGRRGEVWRLSRHLPRLLAMCAELLGENTESREHGEEGVGPPRFVLLTCHTPSYAPPRLKRLLADTLGDGECVRITAETMTLAAACGRELSSGVVARWQST